MTANYKDSNPLRSISASGSIVLYSGTVVFGGIF